MTKSYGSGSTQVDAERDVDARALNRSRGQTVVLITHDPEIAAAASRVVRMHDGCLGEERLELESVG